MRKIRINLHTDVKYRLLCLDSAMPGEGRGELPCVNRVNNSYLIQLFSQEEISFIKSESKSDDMQTLARKREKPRKFGGPPKLCHT